MKKLNSLFHLWGLGSCIFTYCEGNELHLRDEQTREPLYCYLERLEL